MLTGDYVVHIVDDEEPVRKSLAFLLSMAGFAVRVTTRRPASSPVLRASARDAWWTDLRMPDMSGVELLEQLAAAKALMRRSSSPAMATYRWPSPP